MSIDRSSFEDIDFSVQTSEQQSEQAPLIVLTNPQLQSIIAVAVRQATTPLLTRIEALEADIAAIKEPDAFRSIDSFGVVWRRQDALSKAVTELEKNEKNPGKIKLTRAAKITRYLENRPDHKATFETLKGFLGVNSVLLNQTIKTLTDKEPGRYGITCDPTDKRKRTLVLLRK